ncbi:hypothetical protein DRQ25_11790 [Candidatus Fermentibacteria bacterium]|nr:MAG: hypothetical protein DRQ25_11790 [Candidatus Fermentibacteria bacterium]
MTDTAYSILLFSGLIAGPASAFIVDIMILPIYLVFPLIGLCSKARSGTLRILLLVTAPVFILLWGATTGNTVLTERSLRWIAAIAAGASMSGALGASRASELLFSLSRKVNLAGLPESLAMAISLAGPFSERIKTVFIDNRKSGRSYGDSIADSLSSVAGIDLMQKSSMSRQNGLWAAAACLAWLILLAGIMKVL